MVQENPLKQLPILNTGKGKRTSRGIARTELEKMQIAAHLRTVQIEIAGIPNWMTPERQEQIRTLIDNQQQWMWSVLGIDARAKIQHLGMERKIKFFHPAEWRKIEQQFSEGIEIHGLQMPVDHTILVEDKSHETGKNQELNTLNHELTHAISRQTVHINGPGYTSFPESKLNGFQNMGERAGRGVFEYFNEILTEAIHVETLRYLHAQQGKYIWPYTSLPYSKGMVILGLIIEKMAERIGKSPEQLKLDFYRAYYTGDYTILKQLHSVFGLQAIRALAKIKPSAESSPNAIIALGKTFGIPEQVCAQRLSSLHARQPVQVFPGIQF